ncbi:MAG: hypothetical protein WCK89_14630 [bacterium]
MKDGCRVAGELLLMILLLPQAFVFCYFFTYFFQGGDPWGLLKSLALYALTISWVSSPFLAMLTLLVKWMIGARVRWFVVLPLCIGAGYLWLSAWNLLVYDVFAYLRASVPIVLCSVLTAGWAKARAVYLESLTPSGKAKSPAADLSE